MVKLKNLEVYFWNCPKFLMHSFLLHSSLTFVTVSSEENFLWQSSAATLQQPQLQGF